jgi:HEAT repeat protein
VAQLDAPDEPTRNEAAIALIGLGPRAAPAVPVLAAHFRAAGGWVRQNLGDALAAIGPPAVPALLELSADADPEVRRHAYEVLEDMGPDAADAVPVLVGRLRTLPEDDLRFDLQSALGEMGPAAVAPLVGLTADPAPPVRAQAASVLGRLDPPPVGAVPALARLLDDPAPEPRHQAVAALGEIGPAAAPAVPALARLLQVAADPRRPPGERFELKLGVETVLFALGRIGPAAAPALPSVLAVYRGRPDPEFPNDITTFGFCSACTGIGPPARAALPELNALLKRPEYRARAAEAVWQVTGSVEVALPVLIETCRSGTDPNDRVFAVQVLGKMKAAARPARPVLVPLLRPGPEPFLRIQAADAIRRVAGPCPEAVAALADAWHSDGAGSGFPAEIVRALGRMGEHARPALGVLTEALDHEQAEVRREAAKALSRLGPVASATAPALRQAAAGPDYRLRKLAHEALERLMVNP